MRTLIADSGSTKTEWALLENGALAGRWLGEGINPALGNLPDAEKVFRKGLAPDRIFFYGAGCKAGAAQRMEMILRKQYPEAGAVNVESDLLGAARALCGTAPGIACILGTGANTCLYDGERIEANIPTLGYVLGDEGSGANLGKRLLVAVVRGRVPQAVVRDFMHEYGLDEAEIVRKVYREPGANVFLASFCTFLAARRDDPCLHSLIVGEFVRHLDATVVQYGRPDFPVSYTGSIAWHFREELHEALGQKGLVPGEIRQRPLSGLLAYHGCRSQCEYDDEGR